MMSRPFAISLVIACLVMAACGNDGDSEPQTRATRASPSPSVTFDTATVLIDTDEGSVLIDAEVAETDRQRELGLMHRESLPRDAGMVFIFFEPQQGGFWMKNTLIPLSIAYFDVDGEILRILDMKPCKKDPCPSYFPGVEYMGALEVNRGAFEEWGVEEGDVIHVRR
jgi:uncharacterized protein